MKEEIRLEQETMELEATKAKSKELAKQERKLQIEVYGNKYKGKSKDRGQESLLCIPR